MAEDPLIALASVIRRVEDRAAPEATQRPVDTLAELATFREALAYWRSRADRSPLRAATKPPADAIDDEVYDVVLAVVFRELAGIETVSESIGLVQTIIENNLRQIEGLERHLVLQRSADLRAQSVACIGRLHRLVLVL